MTTVIHEFSLLRCQSDSSPLDVSAIRPSAFNWLLDTYCEKIPDERPALFCLARDKGQIALQAQEYVGLLRTPCGTHVEILPKTLEVDDDVVTTRRWLLRMLDSLPKWQELDLRREAETDAVRRPLHEVFIGKFLRAVGTLVKRGIRHGYQAQRGNERFLRGRLLIAEHLRFNTVRRDRFFVEYDAFLMDRPANRLLRSALERVKTWSQDFEHQRLCRELMFVFEDVPASADFRADFARCDIGRGMAHYRSALAWARLILLRLSPLTTKGSHEGMSLLFPMNKLFESYVAQQLYSIIPKPFNLVSQVSRHTRVKHLVKHLVKHKGTDRFELKPDLTVMCHDRIAVVLDAKWKVLNTDEAIRHYGLSQDDFYQMYAYGRKYLAGRGELFLIYPQTRKFPDPLPPFDFDEHLRVHVVPFDMNTGRLDPKAQEMLLAALHNYRKGDSLGIPTCPRQ